MSAKWCLCFLIYCLGLSSLSIRAYKREPGEILIYRVKYRPLSMLYEHPFELVLAYISRLTFCHINALFFSNITSFVSSRTPSYYFMYLYFMCSSWVSPSYHPAQAVLCGELHFYLSISIQIWFLLWSLPDFLLYLPPLQIVTLYLYCTLTTVHVILCTAFTFKC